MSRSSSSLLHSLNSLLGGRGEVEEEEGGSLQWLDFGTSDQ